MGLLQGSLVCNPFDISGLRKLAELSGVGLGDKPDAIQLRRLFDAWGSSSDFAQNVAGLRAWFGMKGSIPSQNILDLLGGTGMLQAQPLRTIYGAVEGPVHPLMIICGGATNWMKARIAEAQRQHDLWPAKPSSSRLMMPHYVVGLASSKRRCDLDTEVDKEEVRWLTQLLGYTPNEAEMMEYLFSHQLGFVGVMHPSSDTQLEPQVRAFAESLPGGHLHPTNVYVPTNPNALFLPLLVRRVLRGVWGSEFDAPGGKHKLYFSQAEGQLATSADELANPARFQNPLTMFSGLVRLVNEMHLLTQKTA